MRNESIESRQLRPLQFATEGDICGKGCAEFTLIFQFGVSAMAFDEIKRFL